MKGFPGWLHALLARLASDVVVEAIEEEEALLDFVLALPILGYPHAPPLDMALRLMDEERLERTLRREAFHDLMDALIWKL